MQFQSSCKGISYYSAGTVGYFNNHTCKFGQQTICVSSKRSQPVLSVMPLSAKDCSALFTMRKCEREQERERDRVNILYLIHIHRVILELIDDIAIAFSSATQSHVSTPFYRWYRSLVP